MIYFRVLQVVQWRLLSFSTAMLRGVEIIIKFMSALYNIDGSKRCSVDIPIYFQMRRGGDQGRASSVINLFESLRLFWFTAILVSRFLISINRVSAVLQNS